MFDLSYVLYVKVKNKWSNNDISKIINATSRTVSNKLNGKSEFSVDELSKIAKEANEPIENFFKREYSKTE